jgi:hypothetical protein
MSNEFELVATITGTSDELGYLAEDVFNDIFEEGPVPSERDFYFDVAYSDKPDLIIATSNQVTINHELPPVITEPPTTEPPTTPPPTIPAPTYEPELSLNSDVVKVKRPDGEVNLTDTLIGFPPNSSVRLKLYRKVTPIFITYDYYAQWESMYYDSSQGYDHTTVWPTIKDGIYDGEWPLEGIGLKGYLFRDGALVEEGVTWELESISDITILDPEYPPDDLDIYDKIVDDTTYIVGNDGWSLSTGNFVYIAPGVILTNAEWDTGIRKLVYGAYVEGKLVATLTLDQIFYLLDSYPSP